jgi:hypothetical protein
MLQVVMSQKFVSEIAVPFTCSRIYESGVIEILHLGDELRATCKALVGVRLR